MDCYIACLGAYETKTVFWGEKIAVYESNKRIHFVLHGQGFDMSLIPVIQDEYTS